MTDEHNLTKAELLSRIQKGWDEFNAYLDDLTLEQLTQPRDAQGWSAKDHLMHIVMWEDDIYMVLTGQSRHDKMGIDLATWNAWNIDAQNAITQKRYKDKPLDEVRQLFREVHQRLMLKLETLTDADLRLFMHDYQPDTPADKPLIEKIMNDTYEHYAEHRPWMAAIVAKK